MNNIMICEYCGNEHDGLYGSGRFCSYECRQKFASKKGFEKRVANSALKNRVRCECEFCKEQFNSKTELKRHKCLKKPVPKTTAKNDWECPFCHKLIETRRKLTEHKKTEHADLYYKPGQHGSDYVKVNCRYCNRELNRLQSLTIHEKYCDYNPNKSSCKGHSVSEETKKKISDTCKKNKLSGGYRKGSGRGKKGTYKGYYCDSSWELAYVIYNLDHNIEFERNEQLFPYEFNGEQHNYKPDFIEGDTYVEIKGYFTEQVKAKENAFPFQLKYIDGKGIIKYLDYVEKTYGKNFISMYDDKTYNIKIVEPKICKCCGKTLNKKASLKIHQDSCFRKKQEKEQKKEQRSKAPRKAKSSWNKMSDVELNRRKELILNSGVDTMKFGWVEKMVKATGLSKHQIEDCVRHFNISFFKRSSAK